MKHPSSDGRFSEYHAMQRLIANALSGRPGFPLRRTAVCRGLTIFAALSLLAAGIGDSRAAEPGETEAFESAALSLTDGFYDAAAAAFDQFAAAFPQSERLLEARELAAHARGEAGLKSGQHEAAASAFEAAIAIRPDSPRTLDALLGIARARIELRQPSLTVEILAAPAGPFQKLAQASPEDSRIARGFLLLSEAYLELSEHASGVEVLAPLANGDLAPDLIWQRDFLLVKHRTAMGETERALQTATNLFSVATAAGSVLKQAESTSAEAGLYQRLNQTALALTVIDRNLATNVPPEYRRQAALKKIELLLASDRVDDAADQLAAFMQSYPDDAGKAEVRMTQAELLLRRFRSAPSAERSEGKSVLDAARALFTRVIASDPAPDLAGRALYHLGWCLWELADIDAAGSADHVRSARDAFSKAVERLERSRFKAEALFKLADCEFRMNEFEVAAGHYQALINEYSDLTQVKESLFDRALYQILRTGVQMGNLETASDAMIKLNDWYPNSRVGDEGMLLVGQGLIRRGNPGDPAAALKVFARLTNHFPRSPLLPEVQLATARAYERAENWPAATRQYEIWLSTQTNHPAKPFAEYYLARAFDLGGKGPEAYQVFTNFTARYPTNALAPLAQNWVADFFYRQGDYINAEKNYQLLFQSTNWPPSQLTHQARLMAGRSAFIRRGFNDARGYFTNLINLLSTETERPTEILDEAFFLLGDVIIELGDDLNVAAGTDLPKPLLKFREAIAPFKQIPGTNRLGARALGRIGDCYLQLASANPSDYDKALTAYEQVLQLPRAELSVRSLAEIGMATVLRKKAETASQTERPGLIQAAKERYVRVFYGQNLRPGEDSPDPFHVQQAGEALATLLESTGEWEQAGTVYQRMMDRMPYLRARMERRIALTRERLAVP